ncbi:hypothetical protein LCGC14_3063050 [marine sediment metagenome]|uniref:Uncharacterized protein n=1 Tax=marine sediment metagenome TaxID=412755 RepID=A0A0F8X6K2_9ZZZZ
METYEAIHYLKILKESYVVFQPEIRDAIDFAIEKLNNKLSQ